VDGILRSLTVAGEVTFGEEKRDGLSGTVKVPMGWSDSDISCVLELITDNDRTCYERLTEINAVFRAREQKPIIYDVSNRHLSARGIRRVVFSKLDSAESSDDDVITVTLSFVEYEPAVVRAEKSETASGGAVSGENNAKPEASLMVDVK
jgi:hypothetical protein